MVMSIRGEGLGGSLPPAPPRQAHHIPVAPVESLRPKSHVPAWLLTSSPAPGRDLFATPNPMDTPW